jgi:hypothetical protein
VRQSPPTVAINVLAAQFRLGNRPAKAARSWHARRPRPCRHKSKSVQSCVQGVQFLVQGAAPSGSSFWCRGLRQVGPASGMLGPPAGAMGHSTAVQIVAPLAGEQLRLACRIKYGRALLLHAVCHLLTHHGYGIGGPAKIKLSVGLLRVLLLLNTFSTHHQMGSITDTPHASGATENPLSVVHSVGAQVRSETLLLTHMPVATQAAGRGSSLGTALAWARGGRSQP